MKKLYCNGKKGLCPYYDGEDKPFCDEHNCEFRDGTGSEVIENITNYDRIRNMSIEEMADFLESTNNVMAIKLSGEYIVREKEYIKQWLQSEVTE